MQIPLWKIVKYSWKHDDDLDKISLTRLDAIEACLLKCDSHINKTVSPNCLLYYLKYCGNTESIEIRKLRD